MWAAEAWGKMVVDGEERPACWSRRREDNWWDEIHPHMYFDDVISGGICETNWCARWHSDGIAMAQRWYSDGTAMV